MKKLSRILVNLGGAVGLSFLLSSCSMNFTAPADNGINLSHHDKDWQSHLHQIEKMGAYQASGQIGILTPKNRYSSAFQWHYQNPLDSQLHLSAFLNMASIDVMMTKEGLVIIDDKGVKHTHQEAENLLYRLMGAPISLAQLAQWLKGIPPQHTSYKVGENHLLKQFTYPTLNGAWKVDYLTYHQDIAVPMPEDILLTNGTTRLKIRIKQWQWENK
ncbi:hypothetical protein A6A19_03035 [Actinobacillus delphinicola]|uniref:lipoprotein insertase outer membrane protein LolB n=1 Tax=Actinobacillus delphinicola TaxID=51161 RepID=UPI002441ED52|nr:lipoprotein insertase outer membrane protein LolB [Actinobacillus delphinicola]MDG6896999.1 hypothetical protein [Actinobacillus delphinicola]